jgi:hypothetical protein
MVTLLLLSASCVLSPPIEPRSVEVNQPPYISPDFILPAEEVVRVDFIPEEGAITLTARQFFDPNNEVELYYAWVAEGGWLIESSKVGPTDGSDLYQGLFYRFGGVEYRFDPCGPNVLGKESETIWIFVSDRPWKRVSNSGVEPESGGFVDSRAWVFQFKPGLCIN